MNVEMKHRMLPLVIVGLFFLQSVSAYGGVEVTLDSLDPAIEDANPWFTVRTGYTRYGFHQDIGGIVETRVIKAGDITKIPVNFFNPFFFYKTNIQLYHPAYHFVDDSAEKMPTIIRTVSFGPFELKSWRSVMDSEINIEKSGPNIHIQAVVDHIYLFIDNYIYEMDRAGKEVDLTAYLPLFKELLAYAKEVTPFQRYSKSIEDLRKKDPAYAARLKANTDGKFMGADSFIAEAEALLQLTPEQRLKLRYHQKHIYKTKVIYNDTMDDSDRAILHDFVESQFITRTPRNRRNKDIEGRRSWKNPETGISYAVGYGGSYTMRIRKSDKYVPCIHFSLSVDLATTIPVEMPTIWGKKSKMGGGDTAKFCDYDGVKKLLLIGAEDW
jgi:hypothetical protein